MAKGTPWSVAAGAATVVVCVGSSFGGSTDGTECSEVRTDGVIVGVEYKLGNVESKIRESVDGDVGKELLSGSVLLWFVKRRDDVGSGSGMLLGYVAGEAVVGAAVTTFTV